MGSIDKLVNSVHKDERKMLLPYIEAELLRAISTRSPVEYVLELASICGEIEEEQA